VNPTSQAFLVEEYRALWRNIESLDSIRIKTVLLYLGALGAILGGVPGLVLRSATDSSKGATDLVGILAALPPAVLFPALIFIIVGSVFVLAIWIHFRSLFVEYTYSLNMIRRAFEHADHSLHRYLVLPTGMSQVPVGTSGASEYMYLFLCVVSAAFVWLTAISFCYRTGHYGMGPPLIAIIPSVVWLIVFRWWYRADLQTTLDSLWTRYEGSGVKEEIATRAYELWLERRDDEIANWLNAEHEVKARWHRRLLRSRSWTHGMEPAEIDPARPNDVGRGEARE